MRDETNRALGEGRWEEAARLISEELEGSPADTDKLAYNLIVSYIKLQRLDRAREAYASFRRIISRYDRPALEKELGIEREKKQRREQAHEGRATVVDNQLKSLDWFKSDTKFADVIGLEKVKGQLMEKVIRAMQYPETYRETGASTSGGVLLYGPPGTGKTLLGRACAGETGGKMMIARISEIESKYHGESAKNLKTLFDQAREKGPAIVFMDEIDAVAPNRAGVGDVAGGTEERATINTFLTELDGVCKENRGVFVLGTSNRPWDIDPAFRRPGRLGKSIYVPPPGTKEREALFRFYLRGKSTGRVSYLKLALMSMGYTPDDIRGICANAAEKKAFSRTEGIIHGDQRRASGPITNLDIIREMRAFGEPTIFEWYAQTLEEMRKLPPESVRQYRDLKRDIEFWYTRGKGRARLYRIIGSLLR